MSVRMYSTVATTSIPSSDLNKSAVEFPSRMGRLQLETGKTAGRTSLTFSEEGVTCSAWGILGFPKAISNLMAPAFEERTAWLDCSQPSRLRTQCTGLEVEYFVFWRFLRSRTKYIQPRWDENARTKPRSHTERPNREDQAA